MIRLLICLILLTLSVVIPIYYNSILDWLILNVGLGWVFGSILIRIIVIVLVTIALFNLKKAFSNLSKVKSWIIIAVSLPVGFGISFIQPIYNVDYGILGDEMQLENISALTAETGVTLANDSEHTLVAFFTSSCPHCMAASEKLGLNITAGQKVPVYSFFPSTKEDAENFLKHHNGEKFTYGLVTNDSLFLALSGATFPSIFLIDKNGKTLNHWVGDELNYSGLDLLLSLKN